MKTDVLIIGCGIGGAAAALQVSQDSARRVVVVTKEPRPAESNSSYAQGGIVGRGSDDTPALLVEDVLEAGAGLADPAAVALMHRLAANSRKRWPGWANPEARVGVT